MKFTKNGYLNMRTMNYTKSTDELPKEFTPVWVRINASRPRKMYRLDRMFYYYNARLNRNGNFTSIGENVLWRYCAISDQVLDS